MTQRLLPLVIVQSSREEARSARERPEGEAAFFAQMAGQGGARRGLRGGPPVIGAARAAYLETQFSGVDDRRPAAGILRRVAI